MRYGTTQVITTDGTITRIDEEKRYDGLTTLQITKYCETIAITSLDQALSEFLKLMDLQKAGAVDEIGIKCRNNKAGRLSRIEKSWSVKDLR